MSDLLSDEKWGWSEVGSVDETVWDQLRNYIPPAGATTAGKTTQPAPSAGATTAGKTTETQPAPSEPGKAYLRENAKNSQRALNLSTDKY